MTNLTITIDEELLRRARTKAAEEGRSLSAVLGELIVDYVGPSRAVLALEEFIELAAQSGASSGPAGRTWTRYELYDRAKVR